MDHEIRAQPAVLGLHAGLFIEITTLQHSRDFDDAAELHFAPAPAYRWRPQGPREHAGRGTEGDDLFREARVRLEALALGLREPLVYFLERLRNGLLITLEGRPGKVQEGRTVLVQRLCSKRLERVPQRLLRLVEQVLG